MIPSAWLKNLLRSTTSILLLGVRNRSSTRSPLVPSCKDCDSGTPRLHKPCIKSPSFHNILSFSYQGNHSGGGLANRDRFCSFSLLLLGLAVTRQVTQIKPLMIRAHELHSHMPWPTCATTPSNARRKSTLLVSTSTLNPGNDLRPAMTQESQNCV